MRSLEELGVTIEVLLDSAPVGLFVVDGSGCCQFANALAGRVLGMPVESLLGEAYLTAFSAQDRLRVQELLFAFERGQRVVVRLDRADGRPAHVLLEVHRMTENLIALTFQDFTEETRTQRNALAQSQIAACLTYGESLQATMDVLAENVCQATGCSACAVTTVKEGPLRQQVIGAWAEASEHGDLLRSVCICDDSLPMEVWRTGKAAMLKTDVFGECSALLDRLPLELQEALKRTPWSCGVSLPLRYKGVGLGTLNCLYTSDSLPDDLEMRFLQTIADQAAVAVENARLFAEVQGKAALEERQRLARDLHDSVSQALYSIGLGAHTALKRLKDDPRGAVAPIEYVLSLARTGLAEMRALILDLRPDALESEGLVVVLRHQLHALSARLGVDVLDDLGDEPSLAPAAREALYRVAREAMANVVKHASATRLTVTLGTEDDFIVLTVSDDGVGFDLQQKFPGHMGLTSMRERVASAGGALVVTSAPGQGTTIRAQVPPLT